MNTNLSKFSAPGRIVFRDEPLAPVAVLVSPHGSCEISLYGAHILSYRPIGHAPVLWLSESYKTLEAGKAIRGGIPVCWPWFGGAATPGLPAHGFVRTKVWQVAATEYDKDFTSITLGLLDDEETLAVWPHPFHIELKVTLGEKLTVELSTHNIGTESIEINEALHTYFRVREITDIAVNGLDGEVYIDKAPNGKDSVQSGAITFSGETDRVYNRHTGTAIISDNGIKRRISIEKTGSAATVVWNPWIDKAARLADMKDDDWHSFVCVETANALAGPITVAPGKSHTISCAITALLLGEDGKPVVRQDNNTQSC